MTTILTLNTGSSSVKFALYRDHSRMLRGQIKSFPDEPVLAIGDIREKVPQVRSIDNAISLILEWVGREVPGACIDAVGHRVVHGGSVFEGPALLDDGAVEQIRALSPLAPGHQPSALEGIAAAKRHLPGAVQTASFDTSFHRSQPAHVQLYALPRKILDQGVRRYGFHGLSYDYLAGAAARHLSQKEPRIVAAHLGSGASLCAIRGRRSVATTMGFTALDGLPMATRCGDIDPGVLLYLIDQQGWPVHELERALYRESGLKGLSGLSGHMPELLARQDDPLVAEALDYFCHRVRIGIGEMAAALGGIDALVFAGGIGENATEIRERITIGLDFLGVSIDQERNASGQTDISADGAKATTLVIPTDEEETIRRDAAAILATGA
ncbi:acetate/propionate family kinase [Parvularcula lutaonensis]|uniref:Acetate kinase n=1 Tax=Parvularcula lutaonensis TaxID=491923 RepID=A0ABV7MFU5_9PROT|nr:acetate/propionate family kinase [Parvularcula lutaonensis]GGY52968.1 acetate kinase [Parvularcula lutaonensis]